MYFELRECKTIINLFRIALPCSDMSTVNQMQAFQSRLTERLTCFAMEIFQEVAHMLKAYQEENDCLRSLLNNVITTQGNIAIMDHKRLAGPATAVREQPPELTIPLVTGAEPCAKRPKMEHTNPLTNVTEEKETDVLQPFASTTKEEQTEVPVSSAVEVSEPLVGASMLEQTGLSEPSGIEGSFPFPDTPRQHQREVSEPLANESNEQKIEYIRSLALEQESGADSGVTMDCPKSYPKEQDTTARQAMAFGDVFAAMEFGQPSTSGEIANQELLLQERPKVSPKKVASGGKRKRCEMCGPLKDTKTQTTCRNCQKYICGAHTAKFYTGIPSTEDHPRLSKSPYKSCNVPISPPDYFLAKLSQCYKDCPEQKPLIAIIADDMESVDIPFSHVPQGYPISSQHLVPSKEDFTYHNNAPKWPQLPLTHHSPESVNWEISDNLRQIIRKNKESRERMQKSNHLSNHPDETCTFKPVPSYPQNLILKMVNKISCRSAQEEEEMKSQALRLYCRNVCVNWTPCNLVLDPNSPWLGAQPHGLVYDPKEDPSFGLVYVSSSSLQSFIDCPFLRFKNELVFLKNTDEHYIHIQGEMMVTGTSWCDLLVFAKEDILVQRIYRDRCTIERMKGKLDEYYFYQYLPSISK
ncbi:uncharacterized protein LOC133483184 isoform X3 [Phyllopteryx taeniolatus]|uniref:uncharacterized protein LOC133483184 isoform X3 n=1 Tax=Phyllopteryx taeniolatus TaxID=161469 RepID=UPI002AD29EE5|nr:uncharacterized protein LOC133483184 isoform X3 [Phyllopteryx taeniolatus]